MRDKLIKAHISVVESKIDRNIMRYNHDFP